MAITGVEKNINTDILNNNNNDVQNSGQSLDSKIEPEDNNSGIYMNSCESIDNSTGVNMNEGIDNSIAVNMNKSIENSKDFNTDDSSDAIRNKVTEAKDNIEAKADKSKLAKAFPLLGRIFGGIASVAAVAVGALVATAILPFSLPLCIGLGLAFVGGLALFGTAQHQANQASKEERSAIIDKQVDMMFNYNQSPFDNYNRMSIDDKPF